MTYEEIENKVYIFISEKDKKDPGIEGAAYIITNKNSKQANCIQLSFNEKKFGNPPFLFLIDKLVPNEGLLSLLRLPRKKEKEMIIKSIFSEKLRIIYK